MSDLDEFTCESDPARLRIVGTWLVEESDECTGGACGLGYGHEPGCGQEPIVDLSTVPGWGDLVAPLIEVRVREARADECEQWARLFDAEVDWSSGRHDYGDNRAYESAARSLRSRAEEIRDA